MDASDIVSIRTPERIRVDGIPLSLLSPFSMNSTEPVNSKEIEEVAQIVDQVIDGKPIQIGQETVTLGQIMIEPDSDQENPEQSLENLEELFTQVAIVDLESSSEDLNELEESNDLSSENPWEINFDNSTDPANPIAPVNSVIPGSTVTQSVIPVFNSGTTLSNLPNYSSPDSLEDFDSSEEDAEESIDSDSDGEITEKTRYYPKFD